jgi:hypothetical protein
MRESPPWITRPPDDLLVRNLKEVSGPSAQWEKITGCIVPCGDA